MRCPPERELQQRDAGRCVVHAVQHRGRCAAQHGHGIHPSGGSRHEPRIDHRRNCKALAVRRHPMCRSGVVADGRVERVRADQTVVCGGTIGSRSSSCSPGSGPADHLRRSGSTSSPTCPESVRTCTTTCSRRSSSAPSGRSGRRRRPARLPVAPFLALAAGVGRAGPAADPLHGADVRAVDGGAGERLHADGRDDAAREPRDAAPHRARARRPACARPNILACEADVESLVAAVELCRRIGRRRPCFESGARPSATRARRWTVEATVRGYVRDTAITYHHQVGTCKMGTRRDSRSSTRATVYGIDGLRVADASMMPAVTTATRTRRRS